MTHTSFCATPSSRTLSRLALAALACMSAGTASAQLRDTPYAYGGLSLGRATGDFGTEAQVAGGLPEGGSVTSFNRDRRETGYKIFGGWQFNRAFAIEGGYFDLGNLGYNAVTLPAGTVDAKFKVNGLNLDLVGTLPLTSEFALLGRVGMAFGRTRARFDTTGAVTMNDASKRNTNGKWGVGAQYAMGSNLLLRGEVERYRINDALGSHVNTNLVSVSLVVPFGYAPGPAPRAQAPAYVAPAPMAAAPAPMPAPMPAPAPAPTVVIVQAAPVPAAPAAMPMAAPRRRVSFAAESLFGFDNAQVNAEGHAQLDRFARELDGTQFDSVVVEGHTDRLGSTAYNQTLSLQRAEAVKSYLVTSGHVDPGKISAVGKGESTPTTAAADCAGRMARTQLIECLRADRRVDVEVSGTR